MLIRFAVENYRSIKTKQELSLVASTLTDMADGLIDAEGLSGMRLLPAVVMYGANASGKSTLVSALNWMRDAILFSHRRSEPDGPIDVAPFLLDHAWIDKPTIFEIDFIVDNVRYHYGFEVDKKTFVSEWLFGYPNDRRQTLFERRDGAYSFGRNLKGQNKVIEELVRPNSLFLSAGVQNNHDQLSKISEFFKSIRFERNAISYSGITKDGVLDPRVILFLKKINTGIISHKAEKETRPEDQEELFRAIGETIAKHFEKADSKTNFDSDFFLKDRLKIKLAHLGSGGAQVYLDFDTESDGTKRLLSLLTSIFSSLDHGTVFVVDELNASLHARACDALIELFNSKETNPHGAQLIATTHDTNLLKSPFLRRDQIWFVEKDQEGASGVYPLTDIKTRKGDDLERAYLQGRYGAIPVFLSIKDIVEAL